MNAMSRAPRSDELSRVLAHCNQCLQHAAPPGTAPVLRMQSGAGLIQGPRAQHVADLLAPLLALIALHLYVPPMQSGLAKLTIRPKVRVSLRLGGAGLVTQCRYFGEAPAEDELRNLYPRVPVNRARAVAQGYALNAYNTAGLVVDSPASQPGQQRALQPALPATVMALAAALPVTENSPSDALARGEVCLRAVGHEPPRRWPIVRVMAGCREVAVPMFSVGQAVCEDTISGSSPPVRSLALCLGEDPLLAALRRPALLMLRRRGPQLALRVESLLGHGNEIVHPVGPLIQSAPWILGVIANKGEGPPMLVVDPLALPGMLDKS
jgi:hypothetical protein